MDIEITKMTAKGQITLPVAIRNRLGLKPGDKVGFIMEGDAIQVVNVSSLSFGKPPAHSVGKAEYEKKETPV